MLQGVNVLCISRWTKKAPLFDFSRVNKFVWKPRYARFPQIPPQSLRRRLQVEYSKACQLFTWLWMLCSNSSEKKNRVTTIIAMLTKYWCTTYLGNKWSNHQIVVARVSEDRSSDWAFFIWSQRFCRWINKLNTVDSAWFVQPYCALQNHAWWNYLLVSRKSNASCSLGDICH